MTRISVVIGQEMIIFIEKIILLFITL